MGTFLCGALVGWAFTYLVLATLAWRKRVPAAQINESGHWEFPVDTMEQMLAIPADRRERFVAELPSVLHGIWKMQASYPLSTLPGAVWVDDALGELRPHIVNAPANAGDAFAARPLASGMSAFGQDPQGPEAKPASPVRSEAEGDAQ